ncbi:hypothetical protein OESDEN_08154 [Oesophagostomum dentatum]|uniref:G-protein coupled receptors family 1 profile domain-containing protein n=1 Tax=Oesophagostomum dentatum TaxID=61180 RepID=A0A0B1T839_OESDE|nr:hypothetical protein OESDEN_08154 [Oesophagostomum dentatum]
MSTIGIVGNTIMIIATFKAKRAKSPCHILIASTCLADLCHESGQYAFVYHFFRKTTMVQSDCFFMQLVPVIGASFGNPLILNLGIDRLIAITLPSRYRFLQTIPLIYVTCHFILPVTYTLYILVWAFLTKNETLVQCSVPQSFGNTAFGLLNQMGTIVNSGCKIERLRDFLGLIPPKQNLTLD